MAAVTINYVTSNKIEIPLAEVLRLLQPLLPPDVQITGYGYDGATTAFIVHLAPTTQPMTIPLAE